MPAHRDKKVTTTVTLHQKAHTLALVVELLGRLYSAEAREVLKAANSMYGMVTTTL